jgi:protein gp37
MSINSGIEWTGATWNPVTGCTKISPGCAHCWAQRLAERFRGVPGHPFEQGFDLKLWEDRLPLPLTWRKPQLVFVNSMSDLFHEKVPDDFILKVFDTMNKADRHTFQILTKRPERMLAMDPKLRWARNMWAGVTVENADYLHRVDLLRQSSAHLNFLSIEPMLGPIPDLNLTGIDWVIVGGESGPKSRPILEEWVIEIRDLCNSAGVKFFFKQWGGPNKKKSGRLLQGRTWDEMPDRE